MLLRFKCCFHRTYCKMSLLDTVKEWRFWLRLLILTFYFLVIAVLLPFLVLQAIKDGINKRDYFITVIGGVFVLMTLPMSFWLIANHMMYYSKPRLQKHIIRILWMVPIYSLNAWFSLLNPDNVLYLNGFRECYEAYVIYSFMMFLFNYLHEKCDDLATTLERKPQTNHIFPLCFLENWKMGRELIHKCKHGILQYTVVRPLTTILGIACYLSGDGNNCKIIVFFTMVVNNVSQFAAMYCLVLFYRATKEELAPMKPIGKFLCIKAVIFFSFFQGVIITVLVDTGMLNPVLKLTNTFSQRVDVASYIQNLFICFEMFLAAIGHHYSFTVDSYAESICSHRSWREALYALWDFSDVGADIKEHLGIVGNSLTRHIRGPVYVSVNSNNNNVKPVTETSPLLVDNREEVFHRSAVRKDLINEFGSSSNATNIC